MAKKALILGVLILVWSPYGLCRASDFDDYTFKACVRNCYTQFSPQKSPTDFANCVYGCKSRYDNQSDRIWNVPG